MEVIIAFFVAVAAGVACHYIIKWLDGDHKDNKWPGGCFATIKEKKKPLTVLHHSLGLRSLSRWTYYRLLPIGIIAYAFCDCKIHCILQYNEQFCADSLSGFKTQNQIASAVGHRKLVLQDRLAAKFFGK